MTPQDATRRHAERYLGTLWRNYWPTFAHLKCVMSKCQKRIEKDPPFHWNQAHSFPYSSLPFKDKSGHRITFYPNYNSRKVTARPRKVMVRETILWNGYPFKSSGELLHFKYKSMMKSSFHFQGCKSWNLYTHWMIHHSPVPTTMKSLPTWVPVPHHQY